MSDHELRRANARLHFRRAVQQIERAFGALDDCMSKLHADDLKVVGQDSDLAEEGLDVMQTAEAYREWAKAVVQRLRTSTLRSQQTHVD